MVELTVVVTPLTIRLPVTVKFVPTLTAPVVDKLVAFAAPNVGVTRVGLVANTRLPEPVSSEITPASSADVVAANTLNLLAVYATVPPVPNATELASVPVKVSVLLAVNVLPSAIVNVEPVAGAVNATLLIDVAVATPSAGVTSVGVFANTNAPVPVSSEMTPANCADVVAANCDRLPLLYTTVPPAPNATELASVPVKVNVLFTVNVLPSAMVNVEPVAGVVNATLLTDVAVATPSAGVTSVGVFANTSAPVPVSSEITPANCADVVAANCAKLPLVTAMVPA